MRNLYNWSKKHIVPWLSKAIFYTVLLIYIWLIWQVITKTELETSQINPTQIKLDLLQASAFLVAWSGLLIAITAKVIDMFRNLDILTREAGWRMRETNRRFKEHIEGHPDMEKQIEELQTWTDRIDEEYDNARAELSRVQTENERLMAENQQLRQQIRSFEETTVSDIEND